ncbi:uncharacterized protein HMPREF1120_08732 [Exophiala dermatitidis NIH/UT8656]|uniref:Uncharacterized protein n=1 Tax=Exophiala dermatitidis (strain ATCC 34100 / CBS 525.76 / NIH/UT8656) TaxID=858893 RepID=H6C9X7_EXODN|nr:uncharacterized protein HMPREF1120_08732 [Exophiala dermatitidis NIH/UT8656]EHY60788.1 hypothetical protein HMPREF1120_08732 [Exophiala dermatitidis NIH/UT8656]
MNECRPQCRSSSPIAFLFYICNLPLGQSTPRRGQPKQNTKTLRWVSHAKKRNNTPCIVSQFLVSKGNTNTRASQRSSNFFDMNLVGLFENVCIIGWHIRYATHDWFESVGDTSSSAIANLGLSRGSYTDIRLTLDLKSQGIRLESAGHGGPRQGSLVMRSAQAQWFGRCSRELIELSPLSTTLGK